MKMYNLLRIFILLVIILLIVLVNRKFKLLKSKKQKIIAAISVFLFYSALFFIPFENLFISFASLEDVIKYYGTGEVKVLICQEESCYAQTELSKNTYQTFIVEKKEGTYKVPSIFNFSKIRTDFINEGSYDILKVRNSKEIYVSGVIFTNTSNIEIRGSDNQVIDFIIADESDGRIIINFFGNVSNYSDDFHISINYK